MHCKAFAAKGIIPYRRGRGKEGRKGKEEYLYSAFLHQGTHKALRLTQFYLQGGDGNAQRGRSVISTSVSSMPRCCNVVVTS